jgi:uncharacterized protein YndB with AHSA1/START domain
LVFVVLGVTAIGYMLPQDHVASREMVFAAAPAAVYEAISDVARYPEWRKEVTSVDVIAAAPLKWREHSGGDAITFEVVGSKPQERLEVRIADPDLPFGGTWTYELMPEALSTRLRITERGEVYNPVFRFMSRFVLGHTATLDAYLAALQSRLGS